MVKNNFSGNPKPAYYRLQVELLEKIENGLWSPGESIPPERHLAESFGVSVGTVKKAVLNLVHEGYLYRIQGKGTFVAGTTLRRESLRYYRLKEKFGGKEARLKVKLLGLKQIKGKKPHNRHLEIRVNQGLYEIQRVFLLAKKPVVYTVSYLPQSRFKNLHTHPVQLFEKTTLYQALEKHYGVPTIYNQELFGIVPAGRRAARVLQIDRGQAVLSVEMIAFTYKDRPYEYRKAYIMADGRKVHREI